MKQHNYGMEISAGKINILLLGEKTTSSKICLISESKIFKLE